eukprot:scaffold24676_cov73-Skeletonema_marinoi.AAC.1
MELDCMTFFLLHCLPILSVCQKKLVEEKLAPVPHFVWIHCHGSGLRSRIGRGNRGRIRSCQQYWQLKDV